VTRMSTPIWRSILLIVLFTMLPGCHFFGKAKISDPQPYLKQVAEIQKIVPVGIPREEAVRKLEEAGVQGDFSASRNTIYYCDLWNRKNGERWPLNVALLFDSQGNFYRTRHSDFDGDFTGSAARATPAANRSQTAKTGTGSLFPENSASPFPPQSSEGTRRGDARRTPFTNPEDFR
jgi:hypothetical protein